MYHAQLNAYALIAQNIGLGQASRLGLLYYEPVTELEGADPDFLIKNDRFFLEFSPKLKQFELETETIRLYYDESGKSATCLNAQQADRIVAIVLC